LSRYHVDDEWWWVIKGRLAIVVVLLSNLLLEDEDLRSNGLDLGDNVGLDELVEVEATKVQQTGVEDTAEVEAGEVEAAEDTELSNGEEIIDLLEEEQGLDVELVGAKVEETAELVEAKVLLEGELLEESELLGTTVETEEVVDVLGSKAAEVAQEAGVKDGAGLRLLDVGGGRSNQGGEGRDDDGGGLHFCGWCVCVSE
jgi:hypothetical protein